MDVLIVEDDELTRSLLTELVSARGHDVTAVPDAQTALRFFRQQLFPLVMIDIGLPGMGGLELCQSLRQEGDCVILMVTEHCSVDTIKPPLAAGADDFFPKPIDPAMFAVRLAVAETLVERARERRELQARLEFVQHGLTQAQRIAQLGSWDWSIARNTLHWSDEIFHIFGVSPNDFGASYDAFIGFVHPEDRAMVQEAVNVALETGEPYFVEHRVVRPDGTEIEVCERGEVFYDQGRPVRMIGTVQDVSERKAFEQQLRRLASYDSLTNVGNRRMFYERLEYAMSHAKRLHRLVAVVYLDLDGFKRINDEQGHEVGDMLLVEVAHRLVGCVRETDTVCRLGGDEFVTVFADVAGEDDLALLEGKIQHVLAQGYLLAGRHYQVSVSMGAALYPRDGADEDALVRCADTAMYLNKRSKAKVPE